MIFIICILISIATAFIGSLVGLGGGAILIPALLFLNQFLPGFAWATPQAIVGVSLIAMVFTALSSTMAYYKAGRVDYRTGLIFLIGSIPGSIIGSWFNSLIQTDSFTLYFGILMIFISALLFIKRKPVQKTFDPADKSVRTFSIDGVVLHYKINIYAVIVISLIVGMLSGLFGIGGGSIMVPAMILLFSFPPHIATATSMFMILFVSLIGASSHIVLGHIEWHYALAFIPGAWIGGRLGAITNQRLNGETIKWVLRIMIVIIGIRLMFDGLS